MDNRKAVVLLSGGLDSIVSLATSIDSYDVVMAINFGYGQRAEASELKAVQSFCKYYSIDFQHIQLPWLKGITKTSLVNKQETLPAFSLDNLDSEFPVLEASAKAVWVPNRNGIFLNIAAAFAESLDCNFLIFGGNLEEANTFPDNSKNFVDALNICFIYSTANNVKVLAPVSACSKSEIVKTAIRLKVPLQLVWSCYTDQVKHCGQCESCVRLKRALLVNDCASVWKDLIA